MKRRDIQADIFALISNGQIWTIQKLAEEIEVSYKTIYRHLHDMAYRLNIKFYTGRLNGGVQFIIERKVNVEKLTNGDMEVIIITLSTIETKSEGMQYFIYELTKVQKEKLQVYNQ